MLEIIWGLKTTALFDVWTFEHILSGISCGSAVMIANKKSIGTVIHNVCDSVIPQKRKAQIWHKHDLIFVLCIAYVWETIEHYLETGLAGDAVAFWFQGVEMWGNRIITDPLMLVFGYWIAKKWNRLILPARILSIAWLFIHVFVFPHSMYLHELWH